MHSFKEHYPRQNDEWSGAIPLDAFQTKTMLLV